MEYYLAIKKSEINSFAGEWMELEIKCDKQSSERQITHAFAHMKI
jgi:hypothetical protein